MPLRWPTRSAMVAKHSGVVCKRPPLIDTRRRNRGTPGGRHVPKSAVDLQASQEKAFRTIQPTCIALGPLKVRSDHVTGPITLRRKRFASCLDSNPDLLELLLQSRVGLKKQNIGFGRALRVERHLPERLTAEGGTHLSGYLPTQIIKTGSRVLPRCRHECHFRCSLYQVTVPAESKEWLNRTFPPQKWWLVTPTRIELVLTP
jgi:hypothetical protein